MFYEYNNIMCVYVCVCMYCMCVHSLSVDGTCSCQYNHSHDERCCDSKIEDKGCPADRRVSGWLRLSRGILRRLSLLLIGGTLAPSVRTAIADLHSFTHVDRSVGVASDILKQRSEDEGSHTLGI